MVDHTDNVRVFVLGGATSYGTGQCPLWVNLDRDGSRPQLYNDRSSPESGHEFNALPLASRPTYADLGANITSPQADPNLGIHLYVDGAPTDAVQLDTSIARTHSIDYVVTDAVGLTSTSTRTVIVAAEQAANDNAPITPLPATGTDTDATSTTQ